MSERAGILTSKSQDLNLVRTHSGGIDEASSNTQAISFENEDGTVGGGQSPVGHNNVQQSRKQSAIVTGTQLILSPPIEEINEEETRFGNSQ